MGRKLTVGSVIALALAYYFSRQSQEVRVGKTVEIKTGKIRGIVSKSRDGRDFYEWLGIPYAQPPVQELRYASPTPAKNWEGTKDTFKYGPKCAQLEMLTNRLIGEEDCLYINVHVPKGDSTSPDLPKGLPVMVWVHGGGFNVMGADDYRPDYFMDEDVILVIMNYRLGSFGFLSTGDKVVRGNMGLKDQALALKWVNENIAAFGGDPKRVTIFGESAGGASTHYLLLSPSTRGLFSKAISQSGVASVPFAFDSPEVMKENVQRFTSAVGCNLTDSVNIVDCLRSRSKDELLMAGMLDSKQNSILKPQMDGHPFRPTVESINDDETFLAEHPLSVVASGKQHKVPWLTGITADEGLLSSIEFHRNEQTIESFESDWEASIARAFVIPRNNKRLPEIAEKIRNFYLPKASSLSKEEKLDQYTKLFSDAVFNFHMSHIVSVQRQFAPVYLYRYNLHGAPSFATILADIKEIFPLAIEVGLILVKSAFKYYVFGQKPHDYGVSHGDELSLLFAMPGIFTVTRNKADPDSNSVYHFSKDLVKLWVDFASKETDVEFRGEKLLPVKREGVLQYLDISEKPKTISEPFKDRMDFLKSLDYLLPSAQ